MKHGDNLVLVAVSKLNAHFREEGDIIMTSSNTHHEEPSSTEAAANLYRKEVYRTYKAGEFAAQVARTGKNAILEIIRLGLQAKDVEESDHKKGMNHHLLAIPDSLWAMIEKNAREQNETPDEWIVDAAYAFIFTESDPSSSKQN